MLYSLPFFAFKLNDRLNTYVMNQSWKVPVFVFCYSPHCGHCKEIHPDWEKLSEEYKNDPKIIVAELNCEAFHHTCSHEHRVNGYPSFRIVLKGNSKPYDGGRYYNGLKEKVEELKLLKMDQLCNVLDNNALNSSLNYPAFVLNFTGNLKEGCAFIDNIVGRDYNLADQFYINYNQSEMDMTIYTEKLTSVQIEKPWSTKNVKKFVKEYKTKPFAIVKWKEIMSKKRPLVILIVSDLNEVNSFNNIAKKDLTHHWAVVTAERFKFLSGGDIKTEDLKYPAALITNSKKNKYILLSKVSENILSQIIGKDFESFNNIQNQKLSMIFRDLILFPAQRFKNRTIYIMIAVVLIAFIGSCAYYVFDMQPTYKFE